jgi:hippurate hydrolase
MCGHDGHITCLIGALAKILDKREIIPKNCTLRAIFQPGEEGCGGATIMINDGVLEGVDEIYGLHNIPYDSPGEVFVKSGPMMAAIDKITFTVKGKGGHSSLIHELINPVYGASLINVRINEMINTKYADDFPKNMRISFPQMETASACNVIPDESILIGTLRIFDNDLRKRVNEDIELIVKQIEQETKCKIDIDVFPVAKSPVLNDENLTGKFIKMLDGKVRQDKIPIFASEDFADYQEKVPGVFFFLAGGTNCGENLHVDNYNFNDEIIERAANIYFKIAEERFNEA